MKIVILVDKKSHFPESFFEKIVVISKVSSRIEDIDIIKEHTIEPNSSVGGINRPDLDTLLRVWQIDYYDISVFITKAKLVGENHVASDRYSVSFHNLDNIGDATVANIYHYIHHVFDGLLTDAESNFLKSCVNAPSELDVSPRAFLPLKEAALVIHGMNTQAYWEKDLSTFMSGNEIYPASGSYGRLLNVVWPPRRKDVRNQVRESYERFITSFPKDEYRLTIIAHSYGTYAFFDFLDKHAYDVFPDIIIFTAPIIRRKHCLWRSLSKRSVRVFVEVAKRDGVAKIAALLQLFRAELAGWTGVFGVKNGIDINISAMTTPEFDNQISKAGFNKPINLKYTGKTHSDFFTTDHFERRWLRIMRNRPTSD
ncbi:MAG: hypothetical protein JAY75_08195 [Candidatus Thiodiazotropha taylori]|nr:hypothetical protein [Candidatus Thiodiazotropha taylori]MCG8094907.1 hypothetical protein [Candidatus Thiodiazotropha endolucinida]MCG7880814.1 hypothetical protein [Candidatus Thiodiazotropha taylori]MCG7884571.1 hypothetical protein [Candidatus Thiodiazotropha taylori]MCG7889031.1 hypothetical protein [Candidatus Thiodiazotropha taylori]